MNRIAIWSLILAAALAADGAAGAEEPLRLAVFEADATIPLGHRCMAVLPVKAKEILDPLEAVGLVLEGAGDPIVLIAVDWCEIRNRAYDRWREALAEAAGTSRERVLVASLHQHDAPVADLEAEELLAAAGLAGELMDAAFHERAVERAAAALREARGRLRPVTRIALGEARVERVASSRRVAGPDGRARFHRGSASGGDPAMRDTPEGLIDPWLKTLSFWDGETPLAALHAYSVHPMSYYGRGQVSADFPGLARRRWRQARGVPAIHLTGASGDVTAGKHNDGSPENRPALAERLFRAMEAAWEAKRFAPVESASLRVAPLELEFRREDAFSAAALERTLADPKAGVRDRILAAMGLSSRRRLERGQPIDLPCLDLGAAQLVLLPGEAFVGYQLMAQRLRPDSFVMVSGYGECWPGYIPTRASFEEGFDEGWRWVAPGSEERMRAALRRVLAAGRAKGGPPSASAPDAGEISADVYPATEANPRYSEGSIAALRDGSLLFAVTEFSGRADHAPARIVARASSDGGRTWGEPRVLQEKAGLQNTMSVSLLRLRARGSALGMFYLVKNGPGDLDVLLRVSEDEGRTFGEPVLVTDAPGYHVMNNDRAVELLDGRLLCPVAWTRDVREENHFVSSVWISDDGGRSWRAGRESVDLPKRGAMEPEVLELESGELLMILRTQLGRIYASRSADRGDAWSPPVPWTAVSPEAPATLRRIPSTGDLLLVWNPVFVEGAGHGGRRTPLAAAVSRDEGETWSPERLLEDRADRAYAYTSLLFAGGRAFISYYVEDPASGRISCRFRSLPIGRFDAGR